MENQSVRHPPLDPVKVGQVPIVVVDPRVRRPGETDREYDLRIRLLSRDLQYNDLKKRFEWTAILAGVATLLAIALGVKQATSRRPSRLSF